MYAQVEKTKEKKSQSMANAVSRKQSGGESSFRFMDNRPEAVAQRKLQEMANNSPRAKQAAQLQAMAENYTLQRQHPIQRMRKKKGNKHNRKNIRLAKTMGFHSSEFLEPITPTIVAAADEIRWRAPEEPEEDAIDIGQTRRQEQLEQHEERLRRAKDNRDQQEEIHVDGIRRQKGGKAKLEKFRAEKASLISEIIKIPLPILEDYFDLKSKAGLLRGKNKEREQYVAWKEKYDLAFTQINNDGNRKPNLVAAYHTIDNLRLNGMEALDNAINELTKLKEKVNAIIQYWNNFDCLCRTARSDFLDDQGKQQVGGAIIRPDQRLRREYPYGGANTDPHLHQYNGNFHLQINDRGRTRRYNIVQNGRRHTQAEVALDVASDNQELHALITNILATQV